MSGAARAMSATDTTTAAEHASRLLTAYNTDHAAANAAAARLRAAGYAAHATGDVIEVPADTATALLARIEELEALAAGLRAELDAPPF